MSKSLAQTIIQAGAKLNPRTLELATVENVNPLKVRIGSLPVSKESLLVSYNLIKHTQKINFQNNSEVQIIIGGNSTNQKNIEIELDNILQVGDTLVVQEIEQGQRYIVLDKVVTL